MTAPLGPVRRPRSGNLGWVRSRALGVLAALALLVVVGATGCTDPAPTASNAVPAATAPDPNPVVWVALGGDETVTADPVDAQQSWTRLVLAQLPSSAQFLDLATEDATVDQALQSQLLALRASPVAPTVATVWLGTAEDGTSTSLFRSRLGAVVDGLRELGVPRIVLVTRTADSLGADGRYAAEVEAVATATGSEFVTVEGIAGSPRDPSVQAAIADQLGPVVVAG